MFSYHLVLLTFPPIPPIHKVRLTSVFFTLQLRCQAGFTGCGFVAPPASYKDTDFGDGHGNEIPIELEPEWGTT